MASPFRLSAQLAGHEADVRAVSTTSTSSGNSLILSGSRDQTARLWSLPPGAKRVHGSPTVLGGHGGFVNATAFLQDGGSEVFALTAGQDKLINAFAVQVDGSGSVNASTSPDFTMIGHQDNVCALDVGPGESYVVSGSWDKTARVWKDWNCVATFKDHLQAVWAVLAVDEDRVLTASADKIIRLWSISRPDKPIATFGGHTDAVRGLTLLSGGQSFASCGNDGTINLYSLVSDALGASNQPLQTLSGHTSFVYSLAILPGDMGEILSAGEDRSVRVWKDGSLYQTITIPAISVWSVDALANGDVVCGSSDGFVRVFTRSSERVADAEEIRAYDATISSQTLNKAQVGDVNKEQLPGKEALEQPGKKEGQVIMIRNGALVEAHQWNAGAGRWDKIGEVVDAVGSGRKQLYKGKEYDYVFDVDIADGVPPLKLPYNSTENPYIAAQRFLEANELPMTYVDQVVHFIEKNTEAVNLGGSEYVDPYTGSSRYSGAPSSSGAATPAGSARSGNVDPFTMSEPVKPKQTSILPQKGYLSFKQANLPAVRSKIGQLNDQLKGSDATASFAMTESDLAALDTLVKSLEAALARGSSAAALDVSSVEKLLTSWPSASRFPALDLYRLAAAYTLTTPSADAASRALQAASWAEPWPEKASSQAKERDTNSMLALRAFANLWNSPKGAEGLARNSSAVVSTLKGSHFAELNKNGRVAFATVVLNYSAFVVAKASTTPLAAPLLEIIAEILEKEEGDSEVVYRTLVALGNVLVSKSAGSLPLGTVKAAQDLGAKWKGKLAEERIATIQREIGDADAMVLG